MEVRISIESRHIAYLVVSLLIISGINYAIAYGGNQPSVVGHNAEEIGEGTIAGVLTISDGKVGIGTAVPGANLDVNGTVRIQGGGPSSGKVLTATNAQGDAAWQSDVGCRICRSCGGSWSSDRGNFRVDGVWNALSYSCSGSWSDAGSPDLHLCCSG